MCNFSTEVNKLEIRSLYFSKNLISSHQTLVERQTGGKSNLIPLLIMKKNAAIFNSIDDQINQL